MIAGFGWWLDKRSPPHTCLNRAVVHLFSTFCQRKCSCNPNHPVSYRCAQNETSTYPALWLTVLLLLSPSPTVIRLFVPIPSHKLLPPSFYLCHLHESNRSQRPHYSPVSCTVLPELATPMSLLSAPISPGCSNDRVWDSWAPARGKRYGSILGALCAEVHGDSHKVFCLAG